MSGRSAWRARDDAEQLWLVGLRIGFVESLADVFTVVVGSLDDSPLMHDGRLLFFTQPNFARQAIAIDPRIRGVSRSYVPKHVYTIFDIRATWAQLGDAGARDVSAGVVDVMNFMFDSLKAIGVAVPEEHGVLLEMADHLTFDGDYSAFLRGTGHSALEVRRGFAWAAWTLAMGSKLAGI